MDVVAKQGEGEEEHGLWDEMSGKRYHCNQRRQGNNDTREMVEPRAKC